MSNNRHYGSTHQRILRGVVAPLRWGLFGVSAVLLVAGTLAQSVALVAMAGANRIAGQAHG